MRYSMSLFFIALVCSGFFQFATSGLTGRKPRFDIRATPPRSIFLESIDQQSDEARHSLKIVNGQAAVRGQFCYQAFLQFSDGRQRWYCGGSLVTPQVVVTAAHCLQGATSALIGLGVLDLSSWYEPGRQVLRVDSSSLKYHEDYDSANIRNDIGVIKLPKAAALSKFICTVKLPSSADSDNNSSYTVSGWGKTSDTTTTSKLMYVVVSGEPHDSCATFYKKVAKYDVIPSQICTSGAGKKSTCNGDSGGPLVQSNSLGETILQGIVSLGINSCEKEAPSVYTQVSYFMNWLSPML